MDQIIKNMMGIIKYFEPNNSENTIYQKLGDTSEVVFRGRFIALHAYVRSEKKEKKSRNQ